MAKKTKHKTFWIARNEINGVLGRYFISAIEPRKTHYGRWYVDDFANGSCACAEYFERVTGWHLERGEGPVKVQLVRAE